VRSCKQAELERAIRYSATGQAPKRDRTSPQTKPEARQMRVCRASTGGRSGGQGPTRANRSREIPMSLSDRGNVVPSPQRVARRYHFVTHNQVWNNEPDTSRDKRRADCADAQLPVSGSCDSRVHTKRSPSLSARATTLLTLKIVGGCRRERSGVRPLRQPETHITKRGGRNGTFETENRVNSCHIDDRLEEGEN